MVTVDSSLKVVGVGRRLGFEARGRIFEKIADALDVNRAGRARMRAMATKRKREVRNRLKGREAARLTNLKVMREEDI